MNVLTVMMLSGNYPDNILITSAKSDNGMYIGFCYIKHNSEIHALLLDTKPVFENAELAEKYLHDIAKQCKTLKI